MCIVFAHGERALLHLYHITSPVYILRTSQGPDLCTQNEDCARCAKNPRGSSIDCGQCDFELIPADRNISCESYIRT